MFKKIIALALSLLLAAAVLPVSALAEKEVTEATQLQTKEEKIQWLNETIVKDYQQALTDAKKESFGGFCGQIASYQLWYRGINDWHFSANGNDYYDIYGALEKTTGGYAPRAYGVEIYDLQQALNHVTKNGTQDVYNILAGFQWTNTEAGAQFGHVVFIYAILDGIVYFTESFATSLNSQEGTPVAVSIERFAQYYSTWTEYEGIVVLGCKEYMDNCAVYDSDMFVRANAPAQLLTMPCEAGQEDCELLRTAACGERLQVIGLYENPQEQLYYQISDGETVCYSAAEVLEPILFLHEGIALKDAVAPSTLAQGEDAKVAGKVSCVDDSLAAVRVQVTDAQQNVMLDKTVDGTNLGTKAFDKEFDTSTLPEGWYTYRILADSINYYAEGGVTAVDQKSLVLLEKPFGVGNVSKKTLQLAQQTPETAKDGWLYEQGTWYCYEKGTALTGWQTADGVSYYLDETGAVTTGWVELDGKKLCFTATGALYTGWIDLEAGRQYLQSDGTPITGWTKIDGEQYYFDHNGIMQRDCWITVASVRRYLQADGSMATGWVELKEGTFGFDINGRLLAQLCQEGDRMILRSCDRLPSE